MGMSGPLDSALVTQTTANCRFRLVQIIATAQLPEVDDQHLTYLIGHGVTQCIRAFLKDKRFHKIKVQSDGRWVVTTDMIVMTEAELLAHDQDTYTRGQRHATQFPTRYP